MAGFFSGGDPYEGSEERRKRRELRKLQKVLVSSRESMISFLTKISFICLFIITAMNVIMEIGMQANAEKKLGAGEFLTRLSGSLFLIWGVFALIIIVLSIIQLVRNASSGYEEREYRFRDNLKEGERLSDFDRVEAPESERDRDALTLYSRELPGGTRAKYLKYILAAGGGAAAAGLFYLICRLVFK